MSNILTVARRTCALEIFKHMKKRYVPCRLAAEKMSTQQLRDAFLIDDIFAEGRLDLYYTDCDRAVVGSACPLDTPLSLSTAEELKSEFFCQRRELGVLNIGGDGTVSVDGSDYRLCAGEVLYVGRGSREVVFMSDNPSKCAQFYLLSYPAHKEFPTEKSALGQANMINLGSKSLANERTINQAICEAKIHSSQLVMGYTKLADGSVWNTMPVHTHERRSEIYMYFGMNPDDCVFHIMGAPEDTRHIVVRNRQVVISPSWSVHSGCGTRAYTFCWGMGGENQRFDDMDEVPMKELR